MSPLKQLKPKGNKPPPIQYQAPPKTPCCPFCNSTLQGVNEATARCITCLLEFQESLFNIQIWKLDDQFNRIAIKALYPKNK